MIITPPSMQVIVVPGATPQSEFESVPLGTPVQYEPAQHQGNQGIIAPKTITGLGARQPAAIQDGATPSGKSFNAINLNNDPDGWLLNTQGARNGLLQPSGEKLAIIKRNYDNF